MTIELNHTIVPAHDKWASARFLAHILGLSVGHPMGPFAPVTVGNGVTLDYADSDQVRGGHYAFLVGDAEFDTAFAKIKDAGLTYWAEPRHIGAGKINTRWGGRGVYFDDPNGHSMELMTRVSSVD